MSSDLPCELPSGHQLARSLAAYMDDPQRISSEIRVAGAKPPSPDTIKRYLRERRLQPYRITEPPFGAHEAHCHAKMTADMAPRSRMFLALLDRERRLSCAVTPVDRAIEMEIAAAREGHGG